jgi:hypothetical protein
LEGEDAKTWLILSAVFNAEKICRSEESLPLDRPHSEQQLTSTMVITHADSAAGLSSRLKNTRWILRKYRDSSFWRFDVLILISGPAVSPFGQFPASQGLHGLAASGRSTPAQLKVGG